MYGGVWIVARRSYTEAVNVPLRQRRLQHRSQRCYFCYCSPSWLYLLKFYQYNFCSVSQYAVIDVGVVKSY